MNPTRWRLAALLILACTVQLLAGCGPTSAPSSEIEFPLTPSPLVFPTLTPVPDVIQPTNPDFAEAQATVAAGRSRLLDLSRQATEDSLTIAQTENAAALATQENNQRQQEELNLQATEISQDIANANATEQSLRQQTRTARNATAEARSDAAQATQTASSVQQTVVAVAQLTVNAEVTQTAQAVAAAQAFPLTETPLAATQAVLLSQEYQREQNNFVNRIVIPLIPIVATILIILLVILVIALVKRQFLPLPWFSPWTDPRTNNYPNDNPGPMDTIDGVISDYVNRPHPSNPSDLNPENIPALPCEKLVYVEVVEANEQPVAHWVDEVEQQLATEG